MNTRIDEIVVKMGLSQYQANVLRSHPDIYVLSKLVKRGCVLYAPRATHGFYNFIQRLIMGRRGDLIGYDKMLVHNQYGIKLFLDGFYSAPIGRFKYYADDKGNIVARNCVRGN